MNLNTNYVVVGYWIESALKSPEYGYYAIKCRQNGETLCHSECYTQKGHVKRAGKKMADALGCEFVWD